MAGTLSKFPVTLWRVRWGVEGTAQSSGDGISDGISTSPSGRSRW